MRERVCPICSSEKFSVFKEISIKEKHYLLAKCLACQFVYVLNPDMDTVNHDTMSCESVPVVHQRYVQTKKLLDRTFKTARQVDILEIGSGCGALGKLLNEDERYQYSGYEPSVPRSQSCRDQGLNVVTGFFEKKTFSGKVDVVILDNVLEHVLHPDVLISDAADVLRPDGLLIVIVPNLHDIRQHIPSWKKRHYWQPGCHINYFTRHHLKRLLMKNGLVFRTFGFCSLDWQRDLPLWLVKVVLDRIGFCCLGLYCYGIKSEK